MVGLGRARRDSNEAASNAVRSSEDTSNEVASSQGSPERGRPRARSPQTGFIRSRVASSQACLARGQPPGLERGHLERGHLVREVTFTSSEVTSSEVTSSELVSSELVSSEVTSSVIHARSGPCKVSLERRPAPSEVALASRSEGRPEPGMPRARSVSGRLASIEVGLEPGCLERGRLERGRLGRGRPSARNRVSLERGLPRAISAPSEVDFERGRPSSNVVAAEPFCLENHPTPRNRSRPGPVRCREKSKTSSSEQPFLAGYQSKTERLWGHLDVFFAMVKDCKPRGLRDVVRKIKIEIRIAPSFILPSIAIARTRESLPQS